MTAPRARNSRLSEEHLLDMIATAYHGRGYEVKLRPSSQDLPTSLYGLWPDLLATRSDDRVAVVIRPNRRSPALRTAPDIDALHAEGWRLELFFADNPILPSAPPDAVAARLREAGQLAESNHRVAALLLLWTAVEEELRGLASRFAPSETGRQIIPPDQAYSLGVLSERQRELLSSLQMLRNQAAHSVISEPIPYESIVDAIKLLDRMNKPTYVPPPIMADRVNANLDPDQNALEQVEHLFPDADPDDQADAVEYMRLLPP